MYDYIDTQRYVFERLCACVCVCVLSLLPSSCSTVYLMMGLNSYYICMDRTGEGGKEEEEEEEEEEGEGEGESREVCTVVWPTGIATFTEGCGGRPGGGENLSFPSLVSTCPRYTLVPRERERERETMHL